MQWSRHRHLSLLRTIQWWKITRYKYTVEGRVTAELTDRQNCTSTNYTITFSHVEF